MELVHFLGLEKIRKMLKTMRSLLWLLLFHCSKKKISVYRQLGRSRGSFSFEIHSAV